MIALKDVVFYLRHCRSNGNPIDKMDECLIIIAESLIDIQSRLYINKTVDLRQSYEEANIDPGQMESYKDFECTMKDGLNEDKNKLKTKVATKSKKK